MKQKSVVIFLMLILLSFSIHMSAVTTKGNASKTAPVADESRLAKLSVTHHSVKIGGKILKYTATAGNMLMKEEKSGKLRATIFFMAYTLDDAAAKTNPGKRPLTFAFNGGPGSASLWLHMGALGPKRVKMSAEGFQLPQPFQYVDNEHSWLEFTDLVFIDPVSTGYSRLAPGVKGKEFHGVRQDVRSVGDFIRHYVSRNQRWLSPKYLCGESYGTTRAAGLSGYLQDQYGMFLKGLVLVSAVLNFQHSDFAPGNDMPYALFLPTFTASAWYHKRLPQQEGKPLKELLAEVERWALTDYTVALAQGNKLTPRQRDNVLDRLVAYTGLTRDEIDRADLRIDLGVFNTRLLKDEKLTVGRLDTRFVRKGIERQHQVLGDDPSYAAILGPYAAVVNHYLRAELNVDDDNPYRIITPDVYPWDWSQANGRSGYVNVAETLRRAMIKNNNLKVLVANGYYDLATPYFATDYTLSHMGLPSSLAGNIVMKYYEAGHMMYIRDVCLKKLKQDVAAFYINND